MPRPVSLRGLLRRHLYARLNLETRLYLQHLVRGRQNDASLGGPVEICAVPARGSVAVFAPHPDDEVLGCGGAILHHRAQDQAVTVLYVTDGAIGAGVRTLPPAERGPARRAEAEQVCAFLGDVTPLFLDLPETRIPLTTATIGIVADHLRRIAPDTVYLPFFGDAHLDHLCTNAIAVLSADEAGVTPQFFAYEVWTPLTPNVLVDISAELPRKLEALALYPKSQGGVDYAHSTAGLNAFRARGVRPGGAAEAFWVADAATYRALFREHWARLQEAELIDPAYHHVLALL